MFGVIGAPETRSAIAGGAEVHNFTISHETARSAAGMVMVEVNTPGGWCEIPHWVCGDLF
jgi:hypothetical protein